MKHRNGFALIEILIAVTILSMVLLSIYSGVSASINAISKSKNATRAIIIAKSKMSDFITRKMRGPDLVMEPVEGYDGFFLTRTTLRFEHPLLGPLPAKITEIVINWKENDLMKKYRISYIFPQ